jgi:DNA glycosylase AlkZ-like
MTPDQVRASRARGQWLEASRGAPSVPEVVAHLVAIQAQDAAAAKLGVGVRADGLTRTDVDRALEVERSIVRTWCLRGTLHLVAATDVHWLLDLVRTGLVAANRTRRRELGLDDADTQRAVKLVHRFLADGPRSRAEIAAHLAEHRIASQGQATIHVIWRAGIDGLVCYGPDREGAETFVLLDDWIDKPQASPEQPVRELVRRYLAAYAPASSEDFVAWSGLGSKAVDHVWPEHQQPGKPPRLHARVRLLPAFDSMWLAYRDHEVLVAPEFQARVFPGGGVIRPIVYSCGRAVGTWSRRSARRAIEVGLNLFEELDEALLARAAADFSRFEAAPVRLVSRER